MYTNFFRIKLPFKEFQIQRVAYSENALLDLKERHNQRCSFFRHGSHIYISPEVGFDEDIGELVTLTVKGSTNVVMSLIRHLVFRTFHNAFPDRIPQSFSPLGFYSEKGEHDIAKEYLPSDLKGKISYSRLIEVEARDLEEDGSPVFGVLIRSYQKWQFRYTALELFNLGYDLLGKSVLESHSIPGLEGVLAPDEELVGEVISIEGDIAVISTNQGELRRKLANIFLQKTKSQIGEFLRFRMGEDQAEEFFELVKNTQFQRVNPLSSYEEIKKFAKWFCHDGKELRDYRNNDGFSFSITSNNAFGNNQVELQSTNLIFDYGPGASESTPFRGLSSHGPFNSERFEKNNLRILALCRPQSRGAMSTFLKRLIDGIPESRAYKRGFKSLFRLASVTPVIQEIEGNDVSDYKSAIDNAIKNCDQSYDIALIECDDSSRNIPVEINPYYNARAALMSYGIPTQGVIVSHLRSPLIKVQWTLSPLALQLYAKVGGTPWRLPASQGVDQEIVIGIGHALERKNLWSGAEQSRVVGITTFFLGDGSYMLGERLKSVPYEEYFEELLSSLKSSIVKVSNEYAWQEGQTIRIVFHVFKPMRNVEADVIDRLVSSFSNFRIIFSFVTISTRHPWIMIRGHDPGRSVTLCERGDNIILDPHTCLLQLRGDKDRPNKKQRPPSPVVVRIHEKSTFKDLKYIVQQIHDFSYLSWRSFYPNETPVTVFYSNLIASETNKLRKVPGWKQEFLDQHFRRKQWFL
ncbi:hypothetical protein [Teredinibacter turnerae]|uniref:hypothetical protein n=1 Tax=Teredinibacter turnerae TaxID=2426 RepID=UPI0030CF7ADE